LKKINTIFLSILTLFIIAYFVNVFANEYGFNFIQANLYIYIIIILFFAILYLSLILFSFFSKIPEQDMISLKRIMIPLDKNILEYITHKYSSNIGFHINTSIMIEKFFNNYEHIDNQIYKKSLKKLLDKFAVSLKSFNSKFSEHSCVNNNIVVIYPELKYNDPIAYNNIIKELDKLGNIVYKNLNELIKYCKLKGHSIY